MVGKRCPNGTRKNKQGECVSKTEKSSATAPDTSSVRKRCPNGTRRNKQGKCVSKTRKSPASSPSPLTTLYKTPNLSPSPSSASYKTPQQQRLRRSPHKIIQSFMKKTKHKRQAHFLKNICSNSGQCIVFGIENRKIQAFFDFTSFKYLVAPINSIGAPSVNGFVKELLYAREGYTAEAIFKSSTKSRADNLFYEYLVGLKINEWNRFFPCFLETYGWFQYTSPNAHQIIQNTNTISDINVLKNNVLCLATPLQDTFQELIENVDYGLICVNSMYYSVLIQHIQNAKLISSFRRDFANSEPLLYSVMAQIYLPLASVDMVHNDLHRNNIIMYSPSPDKYVQFNYYLTNNEKIQFNSKYIAKIIDYGRCYIPESRYIYDKLCATSECNYRYETCGKAWGFRKMIEQLNDEGCFSSSLVKNPSQDLRIFHHFKPDRVVFGSGVSARCKPYGTKPYEKPMRGKKIANVYGARDWLIDFIKTNKYIWQDTTEWPSDKKFGEFHIYLDMSQPMRFVKT